jgi:drug/metabolite transporter (DMT)-like permease
MNFNKLLLFKYVFFDITAVTLQSIALNFIPSSVFHMMRGGTIATTFFFSVVSLKMRAERYQTIGSVLTFIGILIVGLSDLIFATSAASNNGSVNEILLSLKRLSVTY